MQVPRTDNRVPYKSPHRSFLLIVKNSTQITCLACKGTKKINEQLQCDKYFFYCLCILTAKNSIWWIRSKFFKIICKRVDIAAGLIWTRVNLFLRAHTISLQNTTHRKVTLQWETPTTQYNVFVLRATQQTVNYLEANNKLCNPKSAGSKPISIISDKINFTSEDALHWIRINQTAIYSIREVDKTTKLNRSLLHHPTEHCRHVPGALASTYTASR